MRALPVASLPVASMVAALMLAAQSAAAESPREILAHAAYGSRTKPEALAGVTRAIAAADAMLRRNPHDHDARLQRAIALGYRGKLTRSRGEVVACRKALEAIVAANPRNAEAQLALAGWHLGAVDELGGLVARSALGAREASGKQALERALALGRGGVLVPAYASLQLAEFDPKNTARPLALAQAALAAPARTSLDQRLKRLVQQLLAPLRAGNGKAAEKLAERLKPFGRF